MPRIVMLRSAFASVLLIVLSVPSANAVVAPFEPPVPVTPSAMTDQGGDTGAVAATDGGGTWVVAWSSNDRLGGTNATGDDDILFARSTDGGLTFSAEAALNTDYQTDTSPNAIVDTNDTTPALAAHGSRFIAVWHRTTFGSTTIQVARSDDGGMTWTPNATFFDESDVPVIATDGAGTWVIVWEHAPSFGNTFLPTDLYFSRSTDDGLTWSTPAALNAGAAGDALRDIPSRLVYSGGVWVVVSSASTVPIAQQSDVLFWRSVDGGASWSAPTSLDPGGSGAYRSSPSVAGDGAGNWMAVWQSAPSPNGESDIFSARSADGAVTWSTPTAVNTDQTSDGQKDSSPDVATSGGGTYRVVWTRLGSAANPDLNHSDVFTASSSDGGMTWSPPTPLNPGVVAAADFGAIDYGPRVTFDPGGWFFAYWNSNDSTLASGTKGADMDIVMALAGHPCGNGVLDPGEACDDGDRGSLDCCGRACAYDPAGAVCAADTDPCNLERCDGAGTCGHVNAPLGTPCAADVDLCTLDRCDGADVCEHVMEPHPDCLAPLVTQSSRLQLRGDPAGQKLKWIWKHGPTTVLSQFAIYITGANTALCVYDGSGLVVRADAPVDASCGAGASCWKATDGALKYKDKMATPNGVTGMLIKSGKVNKTSATVLGKGGNLALPALPIASFPLRAQLVSENGICLESTFSATGVKRNEAGIFKGKSE
jgi:hypothetical protein